MNNIQHILIRGVNWLGDAIMTLPCIHLIRKAFPDAKIDLLTSQKLSELWKNQPELDTVLTFPNKSDILFTSYLLRQRKIDAALILPNSPRSVLETFFARIPIRFAYKAKWRSIFLTHKIAFRPESEIMRKRFSKEIRYLQSTNNQLHSYTPHSHQIYNYLYLAQNFVKEFSAHSAQPLTDIDPTPRLNINKLEQQSVCQRFGIQSPFVSSSSTLLFGVNVGAEYGAAKRWSVRNFALTISKLSEKYSVRWILLGGSGDIEIANTLKNQAQSLCPQIKIYPVTGKTSLRELAVLTSLCKIVLTNDTGPMHVAAASGATVAVPFLSTSPELTCPGAPLDYNVSNGTSNKHIFLRATCPCTPCFRRECPTDFRCAKEITPEMMISAISKFIDHIDNPLSI